MSCQSISTSFNQYFALDKKEDILKFFPENKNDTMQVLNSKLERVKHFVATGVWIKKSTMYDWAKEHPKEKLSKLFAKMPVERKLLQHEAGIHFEADSTWKTVKTYLKFIGEFIRHPSEVGAILPSFSGLAKEITREIAKDKDAPSRNILEVGPGTGVFTEKIIKKMNPSDRLTLVEFSEEFYKELRGKFGHIKNVTIIQGDINKHEPKEKYDVIVSGLPLNSFKADFVKEVFSKFENIIKNNGKISYFQYAVLPSVKRLLSNKEDRENLNKIMELKQDFYDKHTLRQAIVLRNCPPARVLHHHVKNASEKQS